MTDSRTLFLRHRAGSRTALPQLIERLGPRLRRLALRMGAPRDRADDTVQEMWMEAIRHAARYDAASPLLPWLHALLRHCVSDLRRRERRHHSALLTLADTRHGYARGTGDAAADADEAAHLRIAIAALPSRLRTVMQLHLVDGLSAKQIGQRLGAPATTVRVWIHRGRRALQNRRPRPLAMLPLLFSASGGTLRPRAFAGRTVAAAAAVLFVALGGLFWNNDAEAPVATSVAAVTNGLAALEVGTRTSIAPSAIARDTELPAPRLQVVVTDGRGTAIAGVGVRLEPLDGTDVRLRREVVVTDARGHAAFAAVPPFAARIVADRGASCEIVAGARTATLCVPTAPTLRGIVVGANGAPIADAGIWVGSSCDVPGAIVARSDAAGRFELAAVGDDTLVAAFAPGHARTVCVRAGGDRDTPLRLLADAPGGRVMVEVLAPDGRPLRGARVAIGAGGDGIASVIPSDMPPLLRPGLTLVTDENGRAIADNVECGDVAVAVLAPAHHIATTTAAVVAGQTAGASIRLASCAPMCGVVVDEADRPIAGAAVVVHAEQDESVELTTAADGTFLAEALPLAADVVGAVAPGRIAAHCRVGTAGTPIAIALQPLIAWRGVVVDDAGVPLGDCGLVFHSDEAQPERPDCRARTSFDGSFTAAAPGLCHCRITIERDGWAMPLPVARTWVDRVLEVVRITVPRAELPSARLDLTLHDADGAPLANRTLDLLRRSADASPIVLPHIGRTDADGTFRSRLLPPGNYSVLLPWQAPGLPIGPIANAELAATTTATGTLTLPKWGRLTDDFAFPDGSRPANIQLVLEPGELTPWTTTMPAGAEQLLAPGDYALHVVGDGFDWLHAVPLAIQPGATTHQHARLRAAALVRVQPQTLPPDLDLSAELLLCRGDGGPLQHFRLQPLAGPLPSLAMHLPAGRYELVGLGRDGRRLRAPFTLTDPPAPTDLLLQFAP